MTPSVTVQGRASVAEGESIQLVAVTVPSGAEVTWSSSAEGKATVDENGLVTGVEAGTANITATITVDNVAYTDVCVVTVTE